MGDTDADNSFLSQSVINYPGIKGTEIAFETIRTEQNRKAVTRKNTKRDNKKTCFDPVLLYFVLKEALSTNHHLELSQKDVI